jgi:hypothetical protein
MINRKTFFISNWRIWDDIINEAVAFFHEYFAIYPTILLASDVTLRRIDMATDRSRVRGPDGKTPAPGTYARIDGFETVLYRLDFYIHDRLPDGYFALLFDSDPDGGEPIPEEDNDLDVLRLTGTESG